MATRRRNDRPQRSSPPPPPPMPPGQRHRGDQRHRPPPPTTPPTLPDLRTRPRHPRRRAREDQPAPGQTPTQNPGLSPGQDIHDMLEKAVADGKLDESQRDLILLGTLIPEVSMEELCITLASSFSLPQRTLHQFLLDFANPEVNRAELCYNVASSFSQPQPTLSKELLETTKLEELSIMNSSSPSPPQSPSHLILLDSLNPEAPVEELCITLASLFSQPQRTLREDTDQAVNHDTIKASSPASHNSRPVYSLTPTGLQFKYYVRFDSGESVHTYPPLTGPFKSLEDAQDGIDSHHADQRKMMCMEGLSQMEIGIRRALYWPNGLRKNSAEAFAFMRNHMPEDELVRALLDKYNEDNDLSGDCVYELIDVVRCVSIHERIGSSTRLYYHFNLVIRSKGVDDSHGRINNLFFAEVAPCMNGESEEFVLTFLRMLKPEDNGKCFECDVGMKHPSDVEYKRGQVRIPRHICMEPDEALRAYVEELGAVYDEAKLKAQEARVRKEFKELYDEPLFPSVQNKYVIPAKRQAV